MNTSAQLERAINIAEQMLPIYEKEFPYDLRPRNAIAAAKDDDMDLATVALWSSIAAARNVSVPGGVKRAAWATVSALKIKVFGGH